MLFAGSVKVVADHRFHMEAGNTLRIDRVRLRDGGTYVCAVSTDPVMELTHHLEVLCEYGGGLAGTVVSEAVYGQGGGLAGAVGVGFQSLSCCALW